MNKKSLLIIIILINLCLFIGCGKQNVNRNYKNAIQAQQKGNLSRAQSLFEKSLKDTKTNNQKINILNRLALIHLKQNDISNAESIIKQFGNEKNSDAFAIMSLIDIAKKDFVSANLNIKEAILKNEDNPVLKNIDALIETQINPNNPNIAGWKLEKIVEQYPEYLPARYNLGVIYEKKILDNQSALKHFVFYTNNCSINDTILTDCQNAINRINEQLNSSDASQDIGIASVDIIEQKGSESFKNKKFNQAINYWREALKKDPNRKTLHFNIGLSYHNLGDYNNALDFFTNALEIDGRYVEARYMLSLTYYRLENIKKAVWEVRKAIDIEPTHQKANELFLYYNQNYPGI